MGFTAEEYSERLERLFVRFPSVQQKGFGADSYKAGLQGMQAFDRILSHPWRNYWCVHVAGTNGKGSVSSMICASLAASGHKVGLYTSPHILDFRERMKVVTSEGNVMISRQEVWDFLERYESVLPDLSFFELTTGMALWWFASKDVDYAVIEVGLGGLLDSTNIITPVLSVVTSIGLDHCAMLGSTRAEIAAQKAGIFKKGVKALVGRRDEQTAPVFERVASERGAELHFVTEQDIALADESVLDLKGPYQKLNLATALKALSLLGEGVSPDGISRTGELTGFSGRWQTLRSNPVVIADIGHNPPALEINFERLKRHEGPLYMVYGVMADKDLDSIVPLMPRSAVVFLCQPSTPRALELSALYERCTGLRNDVDFRAAGTVEQALTLALKCAAGNPSALIYVGGSTFVVADAMKSEILSLNLEG